MDASSSEWIHGAWARRMVALRWLLATAVFLACSGRGSEERVATLRSSLCAKTTLAVSTNGPVTQGTIIDATATSPSCGSGETPEYRFLYRQDGAGSPYIEFRGYSLDPSAAFDTTGLPSGRYTLRAQSRAVGSTENRDSQANKSIFIGSSCDSVTMTATPQAPQFPGASISLEASATCSSGTPEYRFLVKPPGGKYTELRSWGGPQLQWETSGLGTGQYVLRVFSRAQGNTSAYEGRKNLNYQLGNFCSDVAATSSPDSVADPGATVTLDATSTCTNGVEANYQFSYRLKGTTDWQLIRAWGPASVEWMTTGLDAGTYQVLVEVRSFDDPGGAQATVTLTYALGGLCSSASLTVSPKSPEPLGAVLSLMASADCVGAPAPQFRFLHRPPATSGYSEIAPWSTSATLDLDTTGFSPGRHLLRVEVRAADSGLYQVRKNIGYWLGDNCRKVLLSASPPAPQPAGTNVVLTATATCDFGGQPEYRFLYQAKGGALTLFRDWDAGDTVDLGPLALPEGDYTLRVEARAQGHTGPVESKRKLAYSFVPPCPSGYQSDGLGGCVDIDECASANGGCDPLTTCTNLPGSFACGPCPAGYTGDGLSGCVPASPCDPNPCLNGGTCDENGSEFTCGCSGGYGGSTCEIEPAILLAAGDVADCGLSADTATGNLLDLHEGTIALLGDAAYPNGTLSEFQNCYDPVWGRHNSRIWPVPGNHEYNTPNAAGYYQYFGASAGDPSKGYYSYDLGTWHIVALNSNCSDVSCAAMCHVPRS